MITLKLTDREIEFIRYSLYGSNSWKNKNGDDDMYDELREKLAVAAGEVSARVKPNPIWDAIKESGNG